MYVCETVHDGRRGGHSDLQRLHDWLTANIDQVIDFAMTDFLDKETKMHPVSLSHCYCYHIARKEISDMSQVTYMTRPPT